MKNETPLEAYYRRINTIRGRAPFDVAKVWVEIDALDAYERGKYLFFQRWGDKTFEQIVGGR